MEEDFESALKRIAELERKIEKYFEILQVQNEIDFILKGSYVFEDEIEQIISGNYSYN